MTKKVTFIVFVTNNYNSIPVRENIYRSFATQI